MDEEDPDLALWQQSISDVTPIQSRARPPRNRADTLRHARMQVEDARAVLDEAMYGHIEPEDWNTGDESQYRRDGVPPGTVRKLRRGQFAVQGTLDLHGLTRAKAQIVLNDFLREARERGWRCLRIIHGKGLRSPRGIPVLKSRVEITLQRTADVLAYCSAPNWAGGHGAVLVLLQRS